jgi:hypothetical protein
MNLDECVSSDVLRYIHDQRARRVNNLDKLALSAKPPSPVQIRTAPPFFLRIAKLVKSAVF